MPELDRDLESGHREHAAPLHPRSDRGARGLTSQKLTKAGRGGPRVLAFDAAGLACSVAVAEGDEVLCLKRLAIAHGQAEALLPLIDTAMREARLETSAVDLIAVTVGPGSFTGIRVGLAAARGISLGLDVPLFGVTGFEAAVAVCDPGPVARFLLVALETRRADLYIQLFDRDGRPLGAAAAIMPEALAETVAATAGGQPLAVAGDAAPRAAAALAGHGAATVVEDRTPGAIGVWRTALRRWRQGERGGGERGGSVRPFYLRPPDVSFAAGWQPPEGS